MKKFLAFIMMLLPVAAWAFTGKVEIDGIYYNLTTKANVAEVTKGDVPYNVDAISIPSSVVYEGVTCNVTSIGEGAFQNCTTLKTINIPSSVTVIGGSAFYGCVGLTDIEIPSGVETIGGSAFRNCSNLVSISLPQTLNSIGILAFCDCTKLESVYITDLESWCKITFWSRRDSPLNYAKHLYVNYEELTDLIIPNTLSTIGDAFWGFSGLKSLVIPEGVSVIGPCAFGNCENLLSVSISNTVTKIDYYAFRGCTALQKIIIPNSVTYIGEEDFGGCI